MVITPRILEGQGTADRYMYTVLCCLLLNISENGHAAYILIFVEIRRFEGGVPSNRPPAANQFAPKRKAMVKDFMIHGEQKGPTSKSEKVPELNLQSHQLNTHLHKTTIWHHQEAEEKYFLLLLTIILT